MEQVSLELLLRERAHITPSTLGQFWTPLCVINIIMALDPPPPLKWWCNMWTKVELLDDFSDTFQIIKICFSTIIRTIFWGLELYSRILIHDSWRNSLVYSWFQVSYSNTCSMFQVSHPSIFKVSAHHHFAFQSHDDVDDAGGGGGWGPKLAQSW